MRFYDFSTASNYWADFIVSGYAIWAFALGVVALSFLCAYLIHRRDTALKDAYSELGIQAISNSDFVNIIEPYKFERITRQFGFSPENSNYYHGMLLDRSVLIFNQSYCTSYGASSSATVKATFAIVDLNVELPDFELGNMKVVKSRSVLESRINPVTLSDSLGMKKLTLQGQNHELLCNIFNEQLCKQLIEFPFIEIECTNNKLLINHHSTRVYTAKGARRFAGLITNIVANIESNSTLAKNGNYLEAEIKKTGT